jgi:tetratricopeptide (TPR) repeat protein
LERAVVAARRLEDRPAEGVHLGNLGTAYRDLGEIEQAIEYYEGALAISSEVSNRRGEGADLGKLGTAYYSLGEVARAIEYFEGRWPSPARLATSAMKGTS